MKKKLIMVLILAFVAPALCGAGVLEHPVGISVWVPDNWKQETDEDILTITSPDEAAAALVMVFPEANSDAITDEIDKELDKIILQKKITDESEININGIPGYAIEGVGSIEGTQSNFVVGCLVYNDHMVMVLGAAESAKYAKYEDTLVKVVKSIKGK